LHESAVDILEIRRGPVVSRPTAGILDELRRRRVRLPVRTTPEADAQIREIDRWWRRNRPASPNLFADELAITSTMSRALTR